MRAIRAILLLVAIATSLPAAAQIAPRRDYGPVVRRSPTWDGSMTAAPNPRSERARARTLRQDISRAQRQGLITRQQARDARRDATRFVRQTGPDRSFPTAADYFAAPARSASVTRDTRSQDVRRCPPRDDRTVERPSYCR